MTLTGAAHRAWEILREDGPEELWIRLLGRAGYRGSNVRYKRAQPRLVM